MDANGTPVTVKYQAVVKEVTQPALTATSTGPQGCSTNRQRLPRWRSTGSDETVEPTFEDGSKEKTIPGEGTYTIAPDGTVTSPQTNSLSETQLQLQSNVDKNGTPVTATYSPEFTKVTPIFRCSTNRYPQVSKVATHCFQLMKQLSQPKMEAKRNLFQVKEPKKRHEKRNQDSLCLVVTV